MPQTRRSTGGAGSRGGVAKGQSTISFSGRVSKSVPRETNKAVVTAAAVSKPPQKKSRTSSPKADEAVPIKTSSSQSQQQEQRTQLEKNEAEGKEEDAVTAVVEPESEPESEPEQEMVKTQAEVQAERVSDAQVKRYWRAVEARRKAPRVHQEGLDVSEKVLRYFDVSSQYGPCVGLDRLKRWQRAERLGLDPPIEVLAVLLKETAAARSGGGDEGDVQRAQMDKILGSTAVMA